MSPTKNHYRLTIQIAFALIALLAVAEVRAEREQLAKQNLYNVPAEPFTYLSNSTLADLDGDGDLDVGAGRSDSGISILEQTTHGAFDLRRALFDPPSTEPLYVSSKFILCDLNRDSLPDLVTDRAIYQNRGQLTFRQTSEVYIPKAVLRTFACNDFDHDGDNDLLLSGRIRSYDSRPSSYVQAFWLLRNDGGTEAPSFTTIRLPMQNVERAFFIDADSRGALEIIGTSASAYQLITYDNENGFEPMAIEIPFGKNLYSITSSNLDSNGTMYHAVITTEAGSSSPFLSIYRLSAQNHFTLLYQQRTLLKSPGARTFWVDINRDSIPDLIGPGSKTYSTVILSKGSNHFEEDSATLSRNSRSSLPPFGRGDLQAIDFDGDQRFDILVSTPSSVSLLKHYLLVNIGGTISGQGGARARVRATPLEPITLEPINGARNKFLRTDSSGRFLFSDLPTGRWQITPTPLSAKYSISPTSTIVEAVDHDVLQLRFESEKKGSLH